VCDQVIVTVVRHGEHHHVGIHDGVGVRGARHLAGAVDAHQSMDDLRCDAFSAYGESRAKDDGVTVLREAITGSFYLRWGCERLAVADPEMGRDLPEFGATKLPSREGLDDVRAYGVPTCALVP
jgi:hypothetical protein